MSNKNKRKSSHERRLRKKQSDINRLRKEGKNEDEIEKYILDKYYDTKNGVVPGKKQTEKRENARQESLNGSKNTEIMKKVLSSGESVKHQKRTEKELKKVGGKGLSNKTIKTYVSSVNKFIKNNKLNTFNNITDDVLKNEIELAEKAYNDGAYEVATNLNKLFSALKYLQKNKDELQFEEHKIGLKADIQHFRDLSKEKGIYRSTKTSKYLKASDDEMNEMYKQLDVAASSANPRDKKDIEVTKDILKTEQMIGTRGMATMSLEVSDVQFKDNKVQILAYRGKGDRTVLLEYKEPEIVNHMKVMVENAENNGQEKLFQMKKNNGKLMSLESSNNRVAKLIGEHTNVTRDIDVSPSRSNSMTGKNLKKTIQARATQHSARKNCAERIYNNELKAMSGMTKKQKDEYKTARIKELNDLEIEGLRRFKIKAEQNGVKDIDRRVNEGPKTLKYYNQLLRRDLNGNSRKTPLSHLSDKQFARYVASTHLAHNRIDVIAAYVKLK